MDELTTVLAVVGALTGVGGLAWHVHRWRQGLRTRIRVGMFRVDSVWFNIETTPQYELLVITALNQSEHLVRVTSVGLEGRTELRKSFGGLDKAVWVPPSDATLPGVLQPHDEGRTSQVIAQGGVRTWEPDDEIRAYVETADDKRFVTPWMRQDDIPKPMLVLDRSVPIPDWIAKSSDARTEPH